MYDFITVRVNERNEVNFHFHLDQLVLLAQLREIVMNIQAAGSQGGRMFQQTQRRVRLLQSQILGLKVS